MLYYVVTGGRFPYKHIDNLAETLRQISRGEVIPPNIRVGQPHEVDRNKMLRPPEVPINDDLEWIVLKALSREQQKRFRNAGEFGDALKQYLRGERVRPKGGDVEVLCQPAMVSPAAPLLPIQKQRDLSAGNGLP